MSPPSSPAAPGKPEKEFKSFCDIIESRLMYVSMPGKNGEPRNLVLGKFLHLEGNLGV